MSLPLHEQMFEQIKRAKQIAIVTPKDPRLDTIAAAFSMGLILQQWNKRFDLILSSKNMLPSFLPKLETKPGLDTVRPLHFLIDIKDTGISELVYDVSGQSLDITITPKHGSWTPKDVTFKSGDRRYDLVIAIDCTDIQSCQHQTKEELELLYQTPTIALGHEASAEAWGQVNLIDISVSSTTELIYQWIQEQNLAVLDPTLSTTLLAGILSKTQTFRAGAIHPQTWSTTSQLIKQGADRERITHELWRNKSVSTLKLWGKMLTRLEQDTQTALAWTLVTKEDLLATNAQKTDIQSAIDEIIMSSPMIKALAVGLLDSDKLELSLFTRSSLHAGKIMQTIGGSGESNLGHLVEQNQEPHRLFREKIKSLNDYLRKPNQS